MIFITGPVFSGKRTFALSLLGGEEERLDRDAVLEAQEMAVPGTDPEALADRLSLKAVVTASEVGCGVVPADPAQRDARERAGRLACLLAQRADAVVRMCCGLPEVLKGPSPEELRRELKCRET